MFVTWQMCDKSWQGFVTRVFAFKSSRNSRTILAVESIGVLRLSAAGIVIIGGWTASMNHFCQVWQIPWQKFVTRLSPGRSTTTNVWYRSEMSQMTPGDVKWSFRSFLALRECIWVYFNSFWPDSGLRGLKMPLVRRSDAIFFRKTYMILKVQIISYPEHQKVWANSSWALRTIHFPNVFFEAQKKNVRRVMRTHPLSL